GRGRGRGRPPGRPVRGRTDPGDGVHLPDRQGPPRRMTTLDAPAPGRITTRPTRSVVDAGRAALWALLVRDAVVVRKHLIEFVVRVLIQPLLLCFVFLYVFPKIGQGVGGASGPAAESAFATVLVPGVV